MSNIVYIATSMDGFITDRNNGLDWLETVPNPDRLDFGWSRFLSRIDAVVMGRKTFETVCGFDCDWPYPKPVFVASRSLTALPDAYEEKAELIQGSPSTLVKQLRTRGYDRIYIDGGETVRAFLSQDLIDDIIITVVPVLLGGGTPLFTGLPGQMEFELIKSRVYLNALVQNHYRRKRR